MGSPTKTRGRGIGEREERVRERTYGAITDVKEYGGRP
jgi:hypothetical protein